MKTDNFDFMSLPEIDAEGNVLPAVTDNGGGDSGFDFMSLPEVVGVKMDDGEERLMEPSQAAEFLRSPEYRQGAAKTIAENRAKIEAGLPADDSQGMVSTVAESALKGGLRAAGKIGGAFTGIATGPMRAVGMLFGRDNALVKGADWVDDKFDWFADDLGVGRKSGDSTADALASVGEVGSSMASQLMPWFVGGGASSKIAGKALFAANVAGAGGRSATQMYDELKAAGADDETALSGARTAQAVSTTAAFVFGKLSLENYLTGIGAGAAAQAIASAAKPTGKGFEGIVKNVANGMMRRDIASRLIGGAEEFATEGVESFVLNAIRQHGSGKEVDLEEALLEALPDAAIGAATGGVLAGVRLAEGRKGFRGAYEKAARAEVSQIIADMKPADIREINPKAFDEAAKKRADGGDISRKDAEDIGLPSNWSKDQRNSVFDSWNAEAANRQAETDSQNPTKKEVTNETGNGANEALPPTEQGAVAVGPGEAEAARPEAVGAQGAEADGVVTPPVESVAETPKTAPKNVAEAREYFKANVGKRFSAEMGRIFEIAGLSDDGKRVNLKVTFEDGEVQDIDMPVRAVGENIFGKSQRWKPVEQEAVKTASASASAETQPITPPKATESAEGGISPSDGTLTPEQAATERKKGKRIPKTEVKTEAKEESAPAPAPVQPTQPAAKQQSIKEATAEFITAHTKTDEKSGKRVLNDDINSLGELTPPTPYIGKTHGKIEKPKKVTDEASAVGVMKDIVSSDGVRQSLGNLHVENGTMVATDGRMAVVAPAPKGLKDGNYKATKRGDPNAGFPQNWKQVIPNISGKKSSYSRVGVIENGDKSVGAIEYADSVSAAMKRVDKESDHVTVKVGDAFINAEYMRKTTRAMFRLGVGNIEVFASGANARIVLKGRNANGEVTGVIMPLRYDGHGNVATDKVTHVRLFGEASQPKLQPKPQSKAAPKAEGSGAKSPSVGKKSVSPTTTTTPTTAFKRGERVFLKGAEKNQSVTFIKANKDGTVDVQVRTPGANRYMPATTETRTVPASEVTATGLKGSLSAKEKSDLEKGRESEAPLRANLAASGILGSPERSAPLKGEDEGRKNRTAAEIDAQDNTDLQAIGELVSELGKSSEKPRGKQRFYNLSKTSATVKNILKGDFFTVKAGVIIDHYKKDPDHILTDRDWVNISEALKDPLVIAKYSFKGKNGNVVYPPNSYRVWVEAQINGHWAMVGVEVKSPQKNISVNAVSTVYGDEKISFKDEDVVYARGNGEGIRTLLGGPNPHEYSESLATPNKVSQGAPKVNRAEKKSEKNPLGQVVPPEDGSVAQAVDREIAQGIPPAPAPGSAANENLNPDYEPESVGLGVKDPVSRQQIVDRFKELFGDTVAIRGRNTSRIGASYSGHYEIGPGIIRSKKPVSMRTIPHEIGHHIDLLLKRTGRARPAAVRMDLVKLGRKLYGTKAPNGGYEAEGFAEIVKYYLQGNDAGLKKEAPAAYDWLVNQFGKDNPDVMARLDDLRGMIDRLQNQSGEDAVRAIRAKDPSLAERGLKKIKDLIDAVDPSAENWLDQGAFISKGMKASGLDQLMDWRKAMKDGDAAKMNEIIENHPVLKWKLYNGKAGARAYQAISKGLTDLSGTRRYTYGDLGMETPGHAADEEIPTFKEIFGDFSKKEMDEFQDYAIARVAKESYIDKGLEFGLTAKEVEPVLRKYADNAKFREALEKYTHYKHGVLHLLVGAGAMSQEQFRAIVDANPIYVKIARRRESTDLFRDRMLKRRGRAVNKRTGSGRQVEDIFDAGLVDDERVFAAAFQADVFRSLVNLGKKGEQAGGSGAGFSIGANWLHEVPNAQGAVKFKAEKLRKQITDAMQNAGITVDKEGANTIFDQIFDDGKDTLTIFKEKPSNGKNGVVSLYDQDGNLHTYELPENNAKGWAEGLMGFTDAQKPNILEKWAQIAAAATRSGATVLNPVFAVRNIVRDSLHAAVANEVGMFIPGVSTVHGIAMDLFNSNPKKMFESMGLQMGSMLGEARLNSARKSNRYIMSKTWYERAWNRGVTKSIADFVGFSENGSRIKKFKNVHDYMLKNGASEKAAAMLAGANALDITIDFQRGGKMARRINKIVPFFNAGIQGLEQTARMIGAIPPKEWQLSGSRKERAIRTLLTGGATITTIALLAELFNHADDDREERMKELPPHEKWNYIPFGDFRIPVPYEIGYIFASIPRAVYAEMVDGDEGAVAECLSMMRKVLPGLSPKDIAGLGPILSVAMNETWTGAAIVPEYAMKGKESYDWVNDRTTEFSKHLAKAFHPIFGNSYMASPAHLDALFNGVTGNMYGRIVGIVDLKRDFDSSRPNTWPVLGTLFRNNATASRVVGDFYERRAELTRKKGSKKTTSYEESELKVMDERAKVMKNWRKQAQAIKEKAGLSAKERNDRLEKIALKIQSIARYHLREWKK